MKKDHFTWTPKRTTRSAARFYEQHARDLVHMASTEAIFKRYEMMIDAIGNTFGHLSPDGPEGVFPEFFEQRRNLRKMIDDSIPVRTEFGLTRCVDSFLVYVSDALTEAMVARPELLKTKEQVALADVLSHGSLSEFVSWAAEKRVTKLSYEGLDEISRYVEKNLGLSIHQEEPDWLSLKRGVAIRNLIVHRRGIIDERFKMQIHDPSLTRGDLFRVTHDDYLHTAKSAMKIVGEFDTRIAVKFSLETIDAQSEPWYSPGRWGEDADQHRHAIDHAD
ncbi:hypothetical protein [Streptomyces sp. XD-27]|uniref:hypothetical protein n=1 Tax=Streptomyces sp. XD-27 TaxID=3062779 RepID=UPI0026F4461B|nr:hypothetical protein [Streptomyces sp. XD-27]WKX72598.1 hypothetical protein Q3Y56_24250 [Streptomyces sp. XD-27]